MNSSKIEISACDDIGIFNGVNSLLQMVAVSDGTISCRSIEDTTKYGWRHDRKDQLQKALDNNFSVVICPRIPFYLDFVQDELHQVGRQWSKLFAPLNLAYKFKIEDIVEEKKLSQILGFQANMWTETVGIDQRLDFMVYPRITALAEAAWGQNEDYEAYLERLKLHLSLYRESNIYFFNPFDKEEQPEPKY